DLGLERLADVHPGIRHEAAREGPLSAARGVERVHGPDTILRRSRCDEGRLEEQLVVAIDVATVLAVDHVGPELAHDLLERRDDIREGDGIEPLIGKAEYADRAHPEGLGGSPHVLRLTDASWAVAERLCLAGDCREYFAPRPRVQRHGAAASQYFIVGMGGDHQDSLR